MSRLSATMVFAPPDLRSLAIVICRWAMSDSSSFMAKQGRDDCVQEQDLLSHCINMIIYNLPETEEMATGRNYPEFPDISSRDNVGPTSALAQSTHLI